MNDRGSIPVIFYQFLCPHGARKVMPCKDRLASEMDGQHHWVLVLGESGKRATCAYDQQGGQLLQCYPLESATNFMHRF